MILEWDSGSTPAILSDDEDDDEDDEADDDDNAGDALNANNAAGAAMPAINPPTTLPPVPVTPLTPALSAGNGANGANGASWRGDDANWTVSCYSKWSGTHGMLMADLFRKLEDIGRPAWIDGRDMWEEYSGVENLRRVVVRGR